MDAKCFRPEVFMLINHLFKNHYTSSLRDYYFLGVNTNLFNKIAFSPSGISTAATHEIVQALFLQALYLSWRRSTAHWLNHCDVATNQRRTAATEEYTPISLIVYVHGDLSYTYTYTGTYRVRTRGLIVYTVTYRVYTIIMNKIVYNTKI